MFNFIKYMSFILVLIGALNWGLVGLLNFDLVAFLFGYMSLVTRGIYVLVGLSAIASAVTAYICHKNH